MKYTDLTSEVGEVYRPTSVLVFYEDSNRYNPQSYVEYLHLDSNGNPTSAQPLTLDQAQALAKTLTCQKEQAQAFLIPKGIIPRRVLHLSHKGEGQAVWYSKAQKKQLFFASSLAIESKEVSIPPLLWKATPKSLWIYALAKSHTLIHLCAMRLFSTSMKMAMCVWGQCR